MNKIDLNCKSFKKEVLCSKIVSSLQRPDVKHTLEELFESGSTELLQHYTICIKTKELIPGA